MNKKLTENWFTRKHHSEAITVTLALTALLLSGAFLYISDGLGAHSWMSVSGSKIFSDGEYWRLLTSLLAHSDFGHIAANSLLFVPLTYLLSSYFGPLHFPIAALLSGALVNLIVIFSMPPQTSLIGISGSVSWMAAAWLTLVFLIDRKERPKRKFGAALFLTLFLFVPETVKPQVSYYSHFVGYLGGAAYAGVFYFFQKESFKKAEAWVEAQVENDPIEEDDWQTK